MGRLGIVGGHSLLGSQFGADAIGLDVPVRDNEQITVLDIGDYVFLQRHGGCEYRPPHRIDHVANMLALRAVGCDRVLALGSVGGLRSDQSIGDVVAPDDFIALDHVVSAFDDARGHRVPGFDQPWRRSVVDAWNNHTGTPVVEEHCTYWQTTGPRFETPAEIRFLAHFADIVGMTIASECNIAGELGLAYAAICVIDNMANGLNDDSLTLDEFETGKAGNRDRVIGSLQKVARALVTG